jgi:hypothetical protein
MKELVGRRLLNKVNAHRGTDENGVPLLEINDFYEQRAQEDLSVDRLGDPNPARDTLRAITTVADREASRSGSDRVFGGWATIRVERLGFPGWVANVIATPKMDEDGAAENPWHADVNRDGFRDKAQAYALAAALRDTFEREGEYQAPERR